jgi:hypothetical protein
MTEETRLFKILKAKDLIHNTPFSSGPNKLERYIKLDWKGLPWISNTLTYWAHSIFDWVQ